MLSSAWQRGEAGGEASPPPSRNSLFLGDNRVYINRKVRKILRYTPFLAKGRGDGGEHPPRRVLLATLGLLY